MHIYLITSNSTPRNTGSVEVEEWEVQTAGCELGSGMHVQHRGYSQDFVTTEWKVTLKHCIER